MTITGNELSTDGVSALNDEAHVLAEQARRHLWMHFSRMGSYSETQEIPIMVRGEGCYVYDIRGKKYMDGLAGLFTSQLGHGRTDLPQAGAKQGETLEFFPLWTYAHPPAIELATKIASLAFYRAEEHGDDIHAFSQWAVDDIERAILREDPNTVAAVFVEPVQNSGGCITPPPGYLKKVRDLCTKYGVLMISDEVICAFGRLGEWFGAIKYDYVPDIITCAKGITSAYAPLGAMIVRDAIMEPFLHADESFLHGFTFAGHPVSCAVALANIKVFEDEDILGHVRRTAPVFREALEGLRDIPIVGDIRGEGFFYGIELVKDQATKGSFSAEEEEKLLRGYLSGALFEKGLICRADDRGDPVIALAPPLISTEVEIDFITSTLRDVLSVALDKI